MNSRQAVFFGLILLVGYVSSTTYYVSIFGSDRNNGLSDKTPFLTLQQCENVAKNGDVIQLLPGVFEGYLNCIQWDKSNVTILGPSSIACSGGFTANDHNMHFQNISFLSTSGYSGYSTFSDAAYTFDQCYFDIALTFYSCGSNITHSHFAGSTSIYHSGGSIFMANCDSEGAGSFSSSDSTVEFHNSSLANWALISSDDFTFLANNSRFSSIEIYGLGNRYYWGNHQPENNGECKLDHIELTCSSTTYGLYLTEANCSVHNLQVHSCVASYNDPASAIMLYTSFSNISHSVISNNFGNSAAYVSAGSNATFNNVTFIANQGNATTLGGGLHVSGHAIVTESVFKNNLAYDGGAFFLDNDASIVIENSFIENNVAYYAGSYDCAPNTEPGAISLVNVQITDNTNISGEGDICPTA